MDYTIIEITGEYPSNYPDSKKYTFRVKDYPSQISAFSKFPMKVGDTIHGNIEVKGQYHNFKWGKKSETPSGMSPEHFDKLYREVYATRQGVQLLTQRLEQSGVIKSSVPYPEAPAEEFPSPF